MQNMQGLDRRQFFIIYGLIGLCVLFSSFFGYQIWQQYHVRKQEYFNRASQEMSMLSQSMANNVQLSAEVIDQLLKRILDKQYMNLLFGGNLNEDVHHSISLWAGENDYVDAVVVTDKEGNVNVTYAKDKPKINITPGTMDAVEELLKHRDADDKVTFFSQVLTPESRQASPSILIGRRMEEVDGTFKGIVSAVVNSERFKQVFEGMAVGHHIKVAMLLDGRDVVLGQDVKELGLDTIQEMLKNALAIADRRNKPYVAEQIINNTTRLVSVQVLDPLPITLLLVGEEKDILAMWRDDMKHYYEWLACFAVILCVIGILIIKLLKYHNEQVGEVDKVKRLMQGKSNYFVKAAEKLVTPVHAITGFSQMLSEEYFGQINKEQKQRLNDIQQCSNQVLESVANISELISADVGGIKLHEEQIDITSVIQGCMQIFAGKLVEQKISLLDQTLKYNILVQADSRRIRQMILHLLSNAVQYTPVGGKITLTTSYDSQQNFIFEIADSGEGINKAELKKILHPFELEEGEEDKKKVSIGLPLCQLYASLHGGKLEVKSKVGGGTRVIFSIPKQRVIEQRVQVYGNSQVTMVAS